MTKEEQSEASLVAEIDQLRVQLAGCSAAAFGATNPAMSEVANRGDWGWSPVYEDVLRLRRRFDKLHDAVKQAMNSTVLPLPILRAIEEINEDMLAQGRGE